MYIEHKSPGEGWQQIRVKLASYTFDHGDLVRFVRGPTLDVCRFANCGVKHKPGRVRINVYAIPGYQEALVDAYLDEQMKILHLPKTWIQI
jgi:hypothetical protein